MASNLPAVTFADLLPTGVSIDQKTITLWEQLQIGTGVYAVGGIPAGVQALAGSKSVDDSAFLQSTVTSELALPVNGTVYQYRYIPTSDKLQIFSVAITSGSQSAPVELSASAIIPSGVLTDVIVGEFIYSRVNGG